MASVFDMYIDMGERIAGKQNRSHSGVYVKNWLFIIFPCCTCLPLRVHLLTLWCLWI